MSAPPEVPSAGTSPTLLRRVVSDQVFRSLTREASGAFALYVGGTLLSFLLNLALARLLGASGAGIFFLALTVATVAALLGRLGLDNAMLRFAAAFAGAKEWGKAAGVERTGLRVAMVSSVGAAAAVAVLGGWMARSLFGSPELVVPLRLMAVAVVPLALARLYGELLKAISRVWHAVLVESVTIPLVALPTLLILAPLLGVPGAALAYLFGASVALGYGVWRWRRTLPAPADVSPFPVGRLLETSLPLLWVAGMDLLMRSVDVLALGAWWTSTEVGIYGVAARVSLLTGFVLMSINAVVAPRFAALHARGETRKLAEMARKSTLLITLLTLPILAPLLAVPEWVLGLFGPEFRVGGTALMILVAGQLVKVVTGPVGYLLMMSGHEKLMRNAIVVAGTANVVLNVVLVPPFGILGAAGATALSLAGLNVASAILVWKTLGIVTLPLMGSGAAHE